MMIAAFLCEKNNMMSVSLSNESSIITSILFHLYSIHETTSEFDSDEAHCVPSNSYLFCITHNRTTVTVARITANTPATTAIVVYR